MSATIHREASPKLSIITEVSLAPGPLTCSVPEGAPVPTPTLLLPPSTNNMLVSVSDSTRKSKSLLSSLKVDEPVTCRDPDTCAFGPYSLIYLLSLFCSGI